MANHMCGVSSIQAQVVRVVKLTADGTPDYENAQGTYVHDSVVSVTITPEITEGASIEQVLANGVTCVKFEDKDRLTGFTIALELCNWDGELMSVLSLGGALMVNGTTDTIGYDFGGDQATACSGSAQAVEPVSFELWTKAWNCNGPVAIAGPPAVTYNYIRWIFPFIEFAFTDSWNIENGVTLFNVSGSAKSNPNYPATGPWGDLPQAVNSLGAMFLVETAPTAVCGFVTTPAAP